MTDIKTDLSTHPTSESLQIQNTPNHFLIQTCSHCNKKMELVEGDMIYGDKWFHKLCWALIKNAATNV